jgi:hypothetical protein
LRGAEDKLYLVANEKPDSLESERISNDPSGFLFAGSVELIRAVAILAGHRRGLKT